MIWFLLLLGAVCVGVVFIWDYRRKAARREAASKQRLEQLLRTTTEPKSSGAAPAAVSPVAVAPAPAAQASIAAFPARERFLGQPEALVYLLLKTALPDHQVFARSTLASILNVPGAGYDREQQLRRLSTYAVDFVVCDRGMRIIAVVDLESAGGIDAAGAERYKSDSLKAAGVNLVRVSAKSLPSRESLRALVCGGPGEPGK